jgi:hypothetical protein
MPMAGVLPGNQERVCGRLAANPFSCVMPDVCCRSIDLFMVKIENMCNDHHIIQDFCDGRMR